MAFLASPSSALAAKWTVATILVGEYEDMQKRLEGTGSSDDVNVVVLHYKAKNNAVAYKLLKDTNTSHPPGQCCPNAEPTCCGIETIPLASIGIDSTVSADAVKKFYQYLVKSFPADHYLLGIRGDPGPANVLVGENFTDGITIVELNNALQAMIDARGGKKIEVLVAGFCESGVLDWAYALSKTVDYYVGSPNFTNPPVATRWRIYRWAREAIEKPTLSSRQLASKVVDHFALTTTDCVENNAGCSNAPKEPWTCVAIDEAKLPAVATAVKDAVCAALPTVTPSMHSSVLKASTLFCSNKTPRYDMASYFTNLKSTVTDPAAKAAIDRVIAAHDDSIVSWKYEPGYYDGKAYGYSFFTNTTDLGSVSEVGDWQIDSLWKAYMTKVSGSSTTALPAATGVVIEPAEIGLGTGQQATLTARGVSSKYRSMCALPSVTWSTAALNGVATVNDASANPVAVTGRQAGTGVLTASASGASAQATVKVTDSASSDGGTPPASSDGGTPPASSDGGGPSASSDGGTPPANKGAAAASGCGNSSAFVVFLPPLLGAGLKRRRRFPVR